MSSCVICMLKLQVYVFKNWLVLHTIQRYIYCAILRLIAPKYAVRDVEIHKKWQLKCRVGVCSKFLLKLWFYDNGNLMPLQEENNSVHHLNQLLMRIFVVFYVRELRQWKLWWINEIWRNETLCVLILLVCVCILFLIAIYPHFKTPHY